VISIFKYKSNIASRKNQALIKLSLKPIQIEQNSLIEFFKSFSLAQRKVLNYFLAMRMRHQSIYSSQARIAAYAGITRQYCNRIIDWLYELGLIGRLYRHRQTCIYQVSEFFDNIDVRLKLVGVFAAFGYLTLFSMFEAAAAHYNQKKNELTPFIRSGVKIKKKITIDTLFTTNEESLKKIVTIELLDARYARKEKTGEWMDFEAKVAMFDKIGAGCKPEDIIPGQIEALTDKLNLTLWGKLHLMAFPLDAISYAVTHLANAPVWKSKWTAFDDLCKEFCLQKDIKPDWRLMYDLLKAFDAPASPPWVSPNLKKEPAAPKKDVARVDYKNKPSSHRMYVGSHASSKLRHPTVLTEKAKQFMQRFGIENPFENNPPEVQCRITEGTTLSEVARMRSEYLGKHVPPQSLLPIPASRGLFDAYLSTDIVNSNEDSI